MSILFPGKQRAAFICVLAGIVFLLAIPLAANPSHVIRHPRQGRAAEFIVVLDENTPSRAVPGLARSLAASYNLEVKQVWAHSLRGFLATGPEQNFEALITDPRVDYVEQNSDGVMPNQASAVETPWFNKKYLWHLDRVDGTQTDRAMRGCSNPQHYCPDAAVSRAQMATLLLRSKYGSEYQPPSPLGIFADVPPSDYYAPWIEQLYREGITAGCNPANYCPNDPVTRGQMAAFLARTYTLPEFP
jgi:hypothetical protein